MSLLRNSRMSPRATVCPALLRAAQLNGRGSVSTSNVGAVGQALHQGEGLGIGGSVVDEHELHAGVRARGGGEGVDTGAQEPRLVAKGDQDAHRDARPERTAQCGTLPDAEPPSTRRVVTATAERLLDVADRCGADVLHVFGERWHSTSAMWITPSAISVAASAHSCSSAAVSQATRRGRWSATTAPMASGRPM